MPARKQSVVGGAPLTTSSWVSRLRGLVDPVLVVFTVGRGPSGHSRAHLQHPDSVW